MDTTIIYVALAILAFACALNLKLNLAVLRRTRLDAEVPNILRIGQTVPAIEGRNLNDKQKTSVPPSGQASVLLYLASKCPKCKSKQPQIENMLAASEAAGLQLFLLSSESAWRLRRFIPSTLLRSKVVRVSADAYKLLNATYASPSYQFINHQGILEASGMIGDDNWQALQKQLGLQQ